MSGEDYSNLQFERRQHPTPFTECDSLLFVLLNSSKLDGRYTGTCVNLGHRPEGNRQEELSIDLINLLFDQNTQFGIPTTESIAKLKISTCQFRESRKKIHQKHTWQMVQQMQTIFCAINSTITAASTNKNCSKCTITKVQRTLHYKSILSLSRAVQDRDHESPDPRRILSKG